MGLSLVAPDHSRALQIALAYVWRGVAVRTA